MYLDEITFGETVELYNELLRDNPELKDMPMSALYEVLVADDPVAYKVIEDEMRAIHGAKVEPNIIAFPTKED